MFATLKNAWKVADLKSKFIFTIIVIVLYRLGCTIPIPYINSAAIEGTLLATGGSICLVPQPTPAALLAEISKNRPNIFAAVPAMLIGLINDEGVKAAYLGAG